MAKSVKINGLIADENGHDIDVDDFITRFIRFVEENGWQAWCGYLQIDDEKNQT